MPFPSGCNGNQNRSELLKIFGDFCKIIARMYSDGYKYWLAYKNENTSYYRCCRYISSKCPGRCLSEKGKVQVTTEHNHPAEPNRALIDKFRKTLTHRAATEKIELHVIYCEEATSRHADAALLYPFTSAESAMRKARRKQLPQTPKSIDEVIDVLDKSDFFRVNSGSDKDPIYQKTITCEDSVLMIFMHKKTYELFDRIEEVHLDASFEFVSATQPTYYMMTAHSVQGNITAPVVYGILTSKTQSAYTAFFSYIREELKIVPNMIISDFDQVMQSSLAYVFPESIIKGCWFLYTDAVLSYMKTLGLQKETAKGIGSSALRMLLVLPLLPPEYMVLGLEALKKWMGEKNIFSKGFSDLCDYVEHCWLRSVGTQKMSIFGATRIMSNHLKKFNKELANIISVQNPVIWVILDSITQLATKIFVRVNKRIKASKPSELSINGSAALSTAGKSQKKSELIADTIISNATQLWIKTPVHLRNTLQFLQLTSHFINDSTFLSYLSDLKETNYLPSTQSIAPAPPVPQPQPIPQIPPTAVPDFQPNNWVHQANQVQEQPTLDYLHPGGHYADCVNQQHPQFVGQQGQLEMQHASYNHCYMQDQFSNLNLGQPQPDHQQQQYLDHQQEVFQQEQQQQQYLGQPPDQFQQQPHLFQHSMMQSHHHMQPPQQHMANHQHLGPQQPILQQQRIHGRTPPSEPPPLRILPHVKRLPCKRRLPLLSELPPLVPISSKRPSKPL